MSEPAKSKFVPSPDAICQDVGGEMVILDLKGDFYFGLDEIGVLIWKALIDDQDQQTLVDQIVAEYDTTAVQIEADISRLTAELLSAGLLTRVEP